MDISRVVHVIDCLVCVQCVMSAAPAPGDVYDINNPPFPSEFNGMGVTNGILATCYAVTAGPNRNLYWVYDDMKSTDSGIQANVPRGTCFETRDSIAISQRRTMLTDNCSTCHRTIGTHMTASQATAAFGNHAAAFPATHARVIAPLVPGVAPPSGMASALGIHAPIPAAGVASAPAAILAITANTPSSSANREDYKLLISMASHRDKWSSTKSIAHEFISKLETALRQSPISAVHWIYLLPLMVSEHDRNMQEWMEATITSPNLSWNAAKAVFIAHYARADWMDSLRAKYTECVQGPHELVQKFTDRFSALMRHLSIGDTDKLNIGRYMAGLRSVIQTKLIEHRSDMRNLPLSGPNAAAPNPSWDFDSFDYVSSKASSFENELNANASVRDQLRGKHHAAASSYDGHAHDKGAHIHKRKAFAGPKRGSTSPRKKPHMQSGLRCKWHPDAKSHSTKDCRNPGTAVVRTTVSTTAVKDLSKIQCYGCGKMGHYKPECPNKEQWNKTKTDKTKQGFKPKARAASVSWNKSIPSSK